MSSFTSNPTAKRLRVLLLDDDECLLRSVRRYLESKGAEVATASEPHQAHSLMKTERFDVLVLDLEMPVHGLEVLASLRAAGYETPTLLYSAYVDVETTVEAMRAGAVDVMQKPAQLDVLWERIQTAVHRRRINSAEKNLEPSLERFRAFPKDAADRILGAAQAMDLVREQIRNAARFPDMPVLITGETGTGKELVAQAIGELSRRGGETVSLNCAAIPDHLFESELFGHEAGAFTGAVHTRRGLLEEAGEGTLFLDEVGELPANLQPKLLRALETRRFRRVGSTQDREFRARIVAATNRGLLHDDQRPMRSDLYFRLAGLTIRTVPLRERKQDIPLLAHHFLNQFIQRYPEVACIPEPQVYELLTGQAWPGNVRELKSVMESAAALAQGGVLKVGHVEEVLSSRPSLEPSTGRILSGYRQSEGAWAVVASAYDEPVSSGLREIERSVIERAFGESGKNVSVAARRLGIPRSTLRDKLRRYGLR